MLGLPRGDKLMDVLKLLSWIIFALAILALLLVVVIYAIDGKVQFWSVGIVVCGFLLAVVARVASRRTKL